MFLFNSSTVVINPVVFQAIKNETNEGLYMPFSTRIRGLITELCTQGFNL